MNFIPGTQHQHKIQVSGKGFLTFFLAFAGWIISIGQANAQDMEVGVYGGGSYYLGDLNPGKHFAMIQPAYGAQLRYTFNDRWAAKVNVYEGTVKGNSSNTKFLQGRDLTFTSPVTDISAEAEFNFFPYFTGSRRNFITPYIYVGVGFFLFNPMAGGQSLRSAGTEGQNIGYDGRKPYKTYNFSIPFGLGVKVSLTRRLGLTVFWEMHKTFTDYLDDVSKTYYLDGTQISANDAAGILSDPTRSHQPEMQRGDSKSNDWYSFSGLTLSYRFDIHGSRKCRDTKHM